MSNAASAARFNGYYLRSPNELSESMRLDNATATSRKFRTVTKFILLVTYCLIHCEIPALFMTVLYATSNCVKTYLVADVIFVSYIRIMRNRGRSLSWSKHVASAGSTSNTCHVDATANPC